MKEFLILLLAAGVMNLVYVAGYLSYCRLVRVRVLKVDLFFPPYIVRTRVYETEVRIGTVPINCSVLPEGNDGWAVNQREGMGGKSSLVRAGLWMAPVVMLVACGSITLGPEVFAREFASGWGQVVVGAWAPIGEGQDLVLGFYERIRAEGVMVAIGLIATKHASLCFVPLPEQNLSQAVITLLPRKWKWRQGADGETIATKFAWRLRLIGILMQLYFGASWIVAIIAATWMHARDENQAAWALFLGCVSVLLIALTTRDRHLHGRGERGTEGSHDKMS